MSIWLFASQLLLHTPILLGALWSFYDQSAFKHHEHRWLAYGFAVTASNFLSTVFYGCELYGMCSA
jgi:hypothetical protein